MLQKNFARAVNSEEDECSHQKWAWSPRRWLLSTVIRRKLKFFGRIKRHETLEKAVQEGEDPEVDREGDEKIA